jgi:radical SAM superfamily enzyme YgiQ (UPF0313 family)
LKNNPHSILFINPIQKRKYTRENILKSYLSIGTLTSALKDKTFLCRFARCSGLQELLFKKESDCTTFDIHVINLSFKPKNQSIKAYLSGFLKQHAIDPFMICVTANSNQLDEANEIGVAAKKVSSKALRVIGGSHVSVLPSDFLKKSDYDIAVKGEGVETITEIALRLSIFKEEDYSGISGIVYKNKNGEIQENFRRKYLFTLDDYPFPSNSIDLFLSDLDDHKKNGEDLVFIFVGFGCPHCCIFCAQKAIHKGMIRERSAENIFSEIVKLHKKGFRNYALVQETFLNNKLRIIRFCELIEQSNLKFEWTVESRANQLDLPLLRRMKNTGLKFIQIGVETGDQELLDYTGKKMSLDEVKRVRDWCELLQINTTFYMLVGLPRQDWRSILKSAVFIRDNLPYNTITKHISTAIAIPYPGTKIAEDNSVKILRTHLDKQSIPERNPKVIVNDDGEFQGENFTETDAMTSEEILESLIYLDDLGQFLLHAKYSASPSAKERMKSLNYAYRMFYMIERRTIRDIIIRAQIDLTPEKRKNAYFEILEVDNDKERRLQDVTKFPEQTFTTFTSFLTNIKFINGYPIMKYFSIPNRIKWMKLCSIIWVLAGKNFHRFYFTNETFKKSKEFDTVLDRITNQRLNTFLEILDNEIECESLFREFIMKEDSIEAFTLRFDFSKGQKIINISTHL